MSNEAKYADALMGFSMPERIRALLISPKGFPVPFFVQWVDDGKPVACGQGTPDFRVMDTEKFRVAMRKPICWICGQPMGVHRVFTIGPMCSINRIISEPPSHRECAEFAVKACPFLANPRMRRNEKNLPEHGEVPGFHLDRNPGATCLWETSAYKPFRPFNGGVLFKLGDPTRVDWWALGQPATRAQVIASINGGYPELERMAKMEGATAISDLARARERALAYLPAV